MSTERTSAVEALQAEVEARLPAAPPGSPRPGLEERCRAYLTGLRWPDGVSCPRCDESNRLFWLESRSRWNCYACRYQFSVTAGTVFHNSHIPLWKWFAAVHLLVESPEGVSANRLRSIFGGSYKTWWFAAHRIRAAMRGHGESLLRGVVDAEAEGGEVWEEVAALLADGKLGSARPSTSRRLRRLLAGPYHQIGTKHLAAYADERAWREANRDNPHLFRDTIAALVRNSGISYEQLVAAR